MNLVYIFRPSTLSVNVVIWTEMRQACAKRSGRTSVLIACSLFPFSGTWASFPLFLSSTAYLWKHLIKLTDHLKVQTYAACKKLNGLFKLTGDWDLCPYWVITEHWVLSIEFSVMTTEHWVLSIGFSVISSKHWLLNTEYGAVISQ